MSPGYLVFSCRSPKWYQKSVLSCGESLKYNYTLDDYSHKLCAGKAIEFL